MELMYLIRTRARTPERSVESIRRRVAEKALCEAEGCRRAKRLRRCGAGIGASSGSRIGLGSSFAVTGLVGLILSVGLMLMGWRGWFVGGERARALGSLRSPRKCGGSSLRSE